jgi:hypothetical protein
VPVVDVGIAVELADAVNKRAVPHRYAEKQKLAARREHDLCESRPLISAILHL